MFGTGGGASFVKTDQYEVFGVGRLDLKTGAWEDLAGALDAAYVSKLLAAGYASSDRGAPIDLT